MNRKFSMLETKEFVIIPNHLHGIVVIADTIVGGDLRVGPVAKGAPYRIAPICKGAIDRAGGGLIPASGGESR